MLKRLFCLILFFGLVLPIFAQNQSYGESEDFLDKSQDTAPKSTELTQPKKHNFSIALETTSYKYNEPHPAVHWDGNMYGVVAKYLGLSILSEGTEIDVNDPYFLALELRYMRGSVDYTGRNMSGTQESSIGDITDYFLEGRILFGGVYEIPKSSIELWPYLGFGYRFLKDGFGEYSDEGGYDRKSNYFYLPIGADAKFKLGKGWGLTLNAEYDLFLYGKQESLMGEQIFSDPYGNLHIYDCNVQNQQNSGYGVRLSVKADKNISPKLA
ncbi:MAG: hypothetical protein LBM71_03425, partial [Elusimicrobiota bacterium]|nr:hypothetical protein [Elusimicrobiota bacterium]